MSDKIRNNQIKSINTMIQDEHEDSADAKRVLLVDEDGNPINSENPLQTTAIVQGDVIVQLDGFAEANPDSSLITGSEDGTKTGLKRAFVNNLKLQILAADDRQQQIFYADFGTKDQRIVRVDYSSAKIGSYIARKEISYTLVGNRYRRDSIDWSII